MSLPSTANKKKRSDRMGTDDEEAADREPPESRMKKRKTNEEYTRLTNSLIYQYQRRIDWYESKILPDPGLEQIYRRVINKEGASIQRLQRDARTLHFEML